MNEAAVRKLFDRYEHSFNKSLNGDAVDMDEVASLYAAEFIGAAPGGVMTGKNDDTFRQALAQGYARNRAIGTKSMSIRDLRLSEIDDLHCLAHVGWTATYERENGPSEVMDFSVHYFVRQSDGEAKVFGWVSGDEQELLKKHHIFEG